MPGVEDIVVNNPALNQDVSRMIDTSHDASALTRFLHLIAFRPQPDMHALGEELELVFGGLNASSGGSAPAVPRNDVRDCGLPYVAAVMAEFQTSRKSVDFGVAHVLDLMADMCNELVQQQVRALLGGGVLSRHQAAGVRRQTDRVFRALDAMIPFLDTNDVSNAEIQRWLLEVKEGSAVQPMTQMRTDMPVVRTLGRHLNRCRKLLKRDELYTPSTTENDTEGDHTRRDVSGVAALFEEPKMRDAVFLLLQPWMVLKFVATFVPGPWNKSRWAGELRPSFIDMRNAELAMFRALMDATTRVRMNLIEHPQALLNPVLQEVIERERSRSQTSSGERDGTVLTHVDASTSKTVYAGGGFRTHVFEHDSGGSATTHSAAVAVGGIVELLIVGGGGGGGSARGGRAGGGGGAGEIVTHTLSLDTNAGLAVRVGGGGGAGASGAESRVQVTDPDNTSSLSFEAAGGGGGGAGGQAGADGGSGGGSGVDGGGAGRSTADPEAMGTRFGSNGGDANASSGGGGGGALQPGSSSGGSGGEGVTLDYVENILLYGAGGDGGVASGDGKDGKTGRANTGSGGSGGSGDSGSNNRNGSGGAGGSGIVVLRYRDGTGGGHIVGALERLGFLVISTINDKYVARQRSQVPRFYHSISLVSGGTKYLSNNLQALNEQLQQRRTNLTTMIENHAVLRAEARRAYVLYVVIAVLVALLLLAYLGLLLWPTTWRFRFVILYGLAALVVVAVLAAWALSSVRRRNMANRVFRVR